MTDAGAASGDRQGPPASTGALSNWLIPSSAALVGALAGLVVTLLTTGYLEAEKLSKQRRSEAVASYLQAAWGGSSDEDNLDFIRKLSLLSVYAPPSVLKTVHEYGVSNCTEIGDSEPRCKQLWVSVVTEMRTLVGSEPVSDTILRELLWGR